jgi:lactoylglutathione lyase
MRYLHTMIRVRDLEKSLKFYIEGMGFKLVKKADYEKDKFTLAFLRAPLDSDDGPQIELTYNWDTHDYQNGNAYGHVAYRVESIDEIRANLVKVGSDLSWGPGKTPDGRRKMAFVDDPDGFEIELLEHS